MNAYLFSGQGSQYVGMTSDLAENFEIAKERLSEANDICGFDIQKIMFEGPAEILKETRYTQLAIFIHSAVVFDILKSLEKVSADGFAGHSVGEFAAFYAANVFSFEDGVKLTKKRGQLMFDSGEKQPGTMFAVIGMDDEKVEQVCSELNQGIECKIIVPANFNSPGQVVVSGSRDHLKEISGKFKEYGARMAKELPVSGAFHSPLMEDAKSELAEEINNTNFNEASKPIFQNYDAAPENRPEELKRKLIEQLVSPVRWTQTLNNMQQNNFASFAEIGPGKVLQGLVKRTLKDVEINGFDKSDDIKNIS
jgi:[acyl-carrier-protein] S-malonyltransferase